MISKDKKKIHLPLQGIKVIQTHNFINILNDLSSIALIAFPLVGNDPELIIVKTSKSDDMGCLMLNALEFNLDPTTKSYFSQAC